MLVFANRGLGSHDLEESIYFLACVAVAGSTLYLYHRLKPRLERDLPVDWPGHESWEPAARDAELAYLSAYRSGLRMPEGLAEDLTMQLRDRVEEKYAALIAEGLEPTGAIAQAIAETGSATELASQARRAEQTWRRLAAGVIGGILASPGAILAYSLLGMALAVPAWFTSGFMHSPWVFRAPYPSAQAAGMLGLSIGFFFLARTGIRICAAVSHRSPASFSAAWALIGTPIVLAYILLVPSVQLCWLMLVAEVLAPIGFAAGAFYRVTKPTVRVGVPFLEGTGHTVTAVLGVAAIFGLVFSLGFWNFQTGSGMGAKYRTDPWPLANVSPRQPFDGPLLVGFRPPEQLEAWYQVTGELTDVDPLPGWTDLRFEFWQGVEAVVFPHTHWDHIAIAQAATGPVLIAPATRVPNSVAPSQNYNHLQGSIHIGLRRDGPIWYISLTGVGPDGVRYRLADPIMYQASISGTAWDWLTAPG